MENQKNTKGWIKVRDKATGDLYRLRIRKLTPLECFRAMGVIDNNAEKILASVSKSQAYKMAGNSIVVDQMYYLFESLFFPDKAMGRNLISMARMAQEYPTDLISRAFQTLKNIFADGKKIGKVILKDISDLNEEYEVEAEVVNRPSLFDFNDYTDGIY